MQEVFELIRLVADSDASVLVHGESGTGKEMVASAIHFNSRRRAKPYVRVSCASLPESLIESELFGYEKGAFTGASERRIGRFEAASGGTLFLDEIGELPLTFQVKLLRVLQERQIERLGSNRPIDVDVRIVSASLRPLEEEIAAGRFREDLYFRVNTVSIHLPPLRDARRTSRCWPRPSSRSSPTSASGEIEGFTDEVLELFESHSWPGNVRELRNVVERAVLFCRGDPDHRGRAAGDAPRRRRPSATPRCPGAGPVAPRRRWSRPRSRRSGPRWPRPRVAAPRPPSCWASAARPCGRRSRPTASRRSRSARVVEARGHRDPRRCQLECHAALCPHASTRMSCAHPGRT